jgi:ribosomal protein L19
MISKRLQEAKKKMKEENKIMPLTQTLWNMEKDYAIKRQEAREIEPFRVGDHIEVFSKVKKDDKIRTVSFEGYCIAKSNKGLPVSKNIGGLRSSFKVLRLSGEQRIVKHFSLHANVVKVKIITKYISRRAKRYDLVRNEKISKISLKRDFSVRNYGEKNK